MAPSKPTEPEVKPASSAKITLRQSLGIAKEKARELAEHDMTMATELTEDSDKE